MNPRTKNDDWRNIFAVKKTLSADKDLVRKFMRPALISPDEIDYPPELRDIPLDGEGPAAIQILGNRGLLKTQPLALFCSIRCPGGVILQTYDLARALRDAGIPVIGGFHSPMEKECLALLLRGNQPVLICAARCIEGIRLPAAWEPAVTEGRLLILSPFEKKHRRITAATAEKRNKVVAALAGEVFIAHAHPNSRTERFCLDLLARKKSLWTIASPENHDLISAGASPLTPSNICHLQKT